MHPALMASAGTAHHSMVSRVECEELAKEFRTDLMSVSSKDPRVIQLRKDLSQFKNKAPQTLAAILTDAHNRGQPVALRLASTISGFFSARTKLLRRKLCDLMQIETIEEGAFNNVQMKIAQGDLSRPTLVELKREIAAYRVILDEMDDAIDAELYLTEIRS